jgi:hypothetical protein
MNKEAYKSFVKNNSDEIVITIDKFYKDNVR